MGACWSQVNQVILDVEEAVGLVVEPRKVTVTVWRPVAGKPFPEAELLRARGKDLGLAFSGGGMRSAVLTIGWLQALNELGILKEVRYVSTISGSTWTLGPLVYDSSASLDQFLGRSVKPEQLNLGMIPKLCGSSHLKVLSQSNFMAAMLANAMSAVPQSELGLIKGGSNVDWWSKTVGNSFFVGLPRGYNSTVCAISKAKASEVEKSLKGMVKKVCAARKNAPFLIMNGCILVGGDRGCIPLEFTPLYYGVPSAFKDIDAVFVEPVGYCASDVTRDQLSRIESGSATTVTVSRVVAIHECSGISSSNIAQTHGDDVEAKAYESANFPMIPCFSAGLQRCVDGGSADNTAILAVLRRGCRNIIAGLACNLSVAEDSVEDANVHSLGTLAGLFGRMKLKVPGTKVDQVTESDYNSQRVVFPSEAWDELIAGMRQRLAAGEGLVHKMCVPVLANPSIGVAGGYTCNIVFTFSGECSAFVNKLPANTRKQLEDDKKASTTGGVLEKLEEQLEAVGLSAANLSTFPYVPVLELKYGPSLIMLMSQLASFTLKQRAEELKALAI